jgi:DNA-binding NtrC family response regulator
MNNQTLAVSGSEIELSRLRDLFAGTSWAIETVNTLGAAKEWLARNPTSVVLCETLLPDGDWKAVLRAAAALHDPPSLVVMSRQADNRLWLEVLNHGGCDVLALPTQRTDLFQVLGSAWRSWKARCRHSENLALQNLALQ